LPFEPENPRDIKKLRDAIDAAEQQLRPARTVRMDCLKQYVGHDYSPGSSAAADVPVNLAHLFVSIHLRHLASARPAYNVETHYADLRQNAFALGLSLNHLVEEIDLVHALQLVALDALCGPMGVCKVGKSVTTAGTTSLHDKGQPFADHVLFENFGFDTAATTYPAATYAYDRYRLPLEFVKDSGVYENTDGLLPSDRSESVLNADHATRTEHLFDEPTPVRESFKELVDLRDVWLREENLIVTLPVQSSLGGRVLRIAEWDGPERGPYKMFGLNSVPGNILPVSPLSLLMPMHRAANDGYNKLFDQIDRQKSVLLGQADDEDTVSAIRKLSDGEVFIGRGVGNSREARFGGPDQMLLGSLIHIKQLFSYFAGNLDLTGGLGSSEETFGQTRLLNASASGQLKWYQDRMAEFARDVGQSLAFYLFYGDRKFEFDYEIEDTGGMTIPVVFDPAQAEGDFLQYNFSIEPHSLQSRSPSEKMGLLNQLMTQVLLQLEASGAMAQNGVSINIKEYLHLMARYENLPELRRLITDVGSGGPLEDSKPITSRGVKSPNIAANRTSQRNPQSQETQMMTALLQGSMNGNGQGGVG